MMRKFLPEILLYTGLVGSLAAAVFWAYWIWQLDWGVSSRGRALMFLAMVFGSIIVFFAGYFTTLYAAAAINQDT
jgi:hypothetical protein